MESINDLEVQAQISQHSKSSQYLSETLDYDQVLETQKKKCPKQLGLNTDGNQFSKIPTAKLLYSRPGESEQQQARSCQFRDILEYDEEYPVQKKIKIEYTKEFNQNFSGQQQECGYKSIAIKTPFVLQSKNSNKKHYQNYIQTWEKQLNNSQNCSQNQQEIQNLYSDIQQQIDQSNNNKLQNTKNKQQNTKKLTSEIILNSTNYYCSFQNCKFVTSSKSTLLSHKRNIHQTKKYQCNQCNFVTKNKVCLLQHQRNLHTNELLECPYKEKEQCDFSAKNNGILQAHINKIHLKQQEEIYECGYQGCTFKTKSLRSCYSHKVNVHSTQMYYCEYEGCQFQSKSKKSYQHHKANVHSTKVIKCPEPGCDFTAKNKVIINNHRKNIHEKCERFCQIQGCYFKSKNQRSLQNHLRNKHGIKSQKEQQEIIDSFQNKVSKIEDIPIQGLVKIEN